VIEETLYVIYVDITIEGLIYIIGRKTQNHVQKIGKNHEVVFSFPSKLVIRA